MYNVPKITLGKTSLVVTRLGIGGAYFDSVDGYRSTLDCGINYILLKENKYVIINCYYEYFSYEVQKIEVEHVLQCQLKNLMAKVPHLYEE